MPSKLLCSASQATERLKDCEDLMTTDYQRAGFCTDLLIRASLSLSRRSGSRSRSVAKKSAKVWMQAALLKHVLFPQCTHQPSGLVDDVVVWQGSPGKANLRSHKHETKCCPLDLVE